MLKLELEQDYDVKSGDMSFLSKFENIQIMSERRWKQSVFNTGQARESGSQFWLKKQNLNLNSRQF